MLRKSALTVGIILVLIGLAGVGMYLAGVLDIVVNEPADRSWLFWGFGFLGFGIVALGSGIGLLILRRNLRRQEESRPVEPSSSR